MKRKRKDCSCSEKLPTYREWQKHWSLMKNKVLSAETDSLRDKGTEEQRHKDAKGKDKKRSLLLCPSVPMCLCNFVPASSCKDQTKDEGPITRGYNRAVLTTQSLS